MVKSYSGRTVVDHLSFRVDKGECFGLLGVNGAGKTTVIRILTMLATANAGSIAIAGHALSGNERAIKRTIGLVPQAINLDADLSAWENLALHGRLHGLAAPERERRATELLEFVELADRKDERAGSFSGGMKRRLMVARALLHRPQLLFLDEPTVGLDPQIRRRFWDLIRRLNEDGMTVLLTTHYIEEAQNLCKRVAILEHGRLLAVDRPAALCRQLGEFVVEWVNERAVQTQQFFLSKAAAVQFAAQLSVAATIRPAGLEDAFVALTGRKAGS